VDYKPQNGGGHYPWTPARETGRFDTTARAQRRAILPSDFTIDAEELTPTLKVRRAVVHYRYQAAIESIYGS